jgi:hypothetical protein
MTLQGHALSGHGIPEEQPDFVIDQLFNFFGNSNNGSPDKLEQLCEIYFHVRTARCAD